MWRAAQSFLRPIKIVGDARIRNQATICERLPMPRAIVRPAETTNVQGMAVAPAIPSCSRRSAAVYIGPNL
jgi:hypothetical protein